MDSGRGVDRIHKAEPLNGQAKAVHFPYSWSISAHILVWTQETYWRRSDTKRATTQWLWLISLIGVMSHVLYLLIKSASGADGIWEQHILIRRSRICISERENERGEKKGRGGADKILGVLALNNRLTFCPVCWLTRRDIRMEHERRTDSCRERWICSGNSWWLICSFHLSQVFCYWRKSMKRSANIKADTLL